MKCFTVLATNTNWKMDEQTNEITTVLMASLIKWLQSIVRIIHLLDAALLSVLGKLLWKLYKLPIALHWKKLEL